MNFLINKAISLAIAAASIASATAAPTVLRIRTIDGVLRVPLPNDDPNSTLSSILASAGVNASDDKGMKCHVGLPGQSSSTTLDISSLGNDMERTAAELGLKHGTMITILPPPMDNNKNKISQNDEKENSDSRFDPFPDLAKSTSFSAASRRSRALSRGVSRGMTYGDISKARSMMHVVEPQSKGPLERVYVCQVGAAKFQNHCIVNITPKKNKKATSAKRKNEQLPTVENRLALLFGTINKERMDQSRKKARTSLSSTHDDDKICDVAKVHAVWEPPMQKPTLNGKHYDEKSLLATYLGDSDGKSKKETATDRAVRVAGWLGLQPVGWMFSYADEDRHEDGDALPVHGRDAVVGAKLQIETMKLIGRQEGCKFVTLTLDGRVGATEAFQLSDVCVQMTAEHVLAPPVEDDASKSTRFLTLKDPVVISGEEKKELDSVLLIVNTAMLSHVGLYSGGVSAPVGGNVKRGSGALLAKTRKRILAALNDGDELKELCDFDTLLALDSLVGKKDSEKLCLLVRKYARGQKKGTRLDDHLKLSLQSALGG